MRKLLLKLLGNLGITRMSRFIKCKQRSQCLTVRFNLSLRGLNKLPKMSKLPTH